MNANQKDSANAFLKAYKILIFLFPLLAILLAVTFSLSVQDYDALIGHMAKGSLPFGLACAFVALAVLLMGLCFLLSRKRASLTENPDENLLTCFGAVLTALLSFLCLFSAAGSLTSITMPATLAAFLTPFMGISMALSLFPNKRYSSLRRFCAVCAALAVNLSLFADYFDFSLPLNSPIRNLNILMKAFALLYLLSEARLSFGKASGRFSLALSTCSAGLTASVTLGYAVGAVVASLIRTDFFTDQSLFTLALYAALGLHAVGRLFSLRSAIGPYEAPADVPENKD